MILAEPVIQALQVLAVVVLAPGVTGTIARVEARLQGRVGPRILQPYYNLSKFFRKEALQPIDSGWVFLLGPVLAFACYLTIPMLLPVLTTFPLPLGYMGDIIGGGFLLVLASFSVAAAATVTGAPYAQMGAGRAKTFGAITEPVILFVAFTAAFVTGTDNPYAMSATLRGALGEVVRPAHLLAAAALFMVILFETARIPIETHSGLNEFGMIEEARGFEHSGPYLAMLRWGSSMKQLILFVLLLNVFLVPWGLAESRAPGAVLLAVALLAVKSAALGCVIAVINNSFAKLRLFKITEFVAAAFLLAVIAVFTLFLGSPS